MQKKNIVIYGNCQAEIVARFLRRLPDISGRYDVFYHFVSIKENEFAAWEEQINSAEIVLAQDVVNWSGYPFRHIAEGKRLVRFPFVRFAALWPFDATQGLPDEVAIAARPSLPHELVFDYQDSLLAKLRNEIADVDERFLAYRTLSFGKTINLRRFLEAEIARLAAADKKYNANIGQFIVDNFRQKRLFHTITHPSVELLAKLAASTCKAADLPSEFDSEGVADDAAAYQVPMHPRVISDLGIEWANDETRYNFKRRTLTFESYYRAYIFLYS